MVHHFSIARSLVPTEQYQPIRPGGRSSSETLNRLFVSAASDLQTIRQEVEDLVRSQYRTYETYSDQMRALSSLVSGLRFSLPINTSMLPVDFFTPRFLRSYSPDGINMLYGQATARISAERSLLKYRDRAQELWVVDGTSISVARSNAGAPSEEDYQPEDDLRFALDDRLDTAWRVPTQGFSSVWVTLDTAMLFTTTRANAVCFVPYPVFGVHVARVLIEADGGWSDLDLSYAVGYQAGVGIMRAGPTRLLFDERSVSRVRFQLVPQAGVNHVGFCHLDVQRIDFSEPHQVEISVEGTVTGVTVFGKDPASLQSLATRSGNLVTLSIRPTSSSRSPVVTGVGIIR